MARMRTGLAAVLAFSLVVTACMEQPCLPWPDDILPLLVGTETRIPTGVVVGTDCQAHNDPRFLWSSDDEETVQVTRDCLIRGLAPGVFHVTATRGTWKLTSEGFVMPAGWTLKMVPPSATAQVGDSVSFRVVPYDASGQEISGIPFYLYVPAFPQPGSDRPPPGKTYQYQHKLDPVGVRAERVGQMKVTGQIGRQSVTALFTILPADRKP